MLALTCERARLQDGDAILELGCGWGSLTLWMAERYPNARITPSRTRARRSSSSTRGRGARPAQRRGDHLRHANVFDPPERRFDRVVSVEMFEHMRNYETLLAASPAGCARGPRCSCTSSRTASSPTRSK
jgi:cyclopropane-fatty-acyl-phospholipid synthase